VDFYERLGAQISAARTERRITQAQLSSEIGLTRSSVANIEVGKQRITVETLVKIAQALGREPATLIPPTEPVRAGVLLRAGSVEVSEGLIDQVEKHLPGPEGGNRAKTARKGGRRAVSATRD
jgi:transcriptional regulator with XRE-family HTH domain